MTNDRFEEFLTVHGDAYNSPPPTPRDEIWKAIEGAIVDEVASDRHVVSIASARAEKLGAATRRQHWGTWAAAAAAVLVVGVGIGRMSVNPPATGALEVAVAPGAATKTLRSVALSHLARTETLLTMVSSDARAGRVDAELAQWGRGLLLQTRLLMDSRASEDPVIGKLLQDLEVILMQVAGLSSGGQDGARDREELDMITQGLDDQNMMLRIRSVIPSGSVQAGI